MAGEVGSNRHPEKQITDWASEIWDFCPSIARRRSSKADLERALRSALKRGQDLAAVTEGLRAYYASPDARKDNCQFAKGPHVMVRNERWEAYEAEPDPVSQLVEEDPWPRRLLQWERAAYWNSEWGPKPGKPGYRGPPLAELAA
ncbi:hypothetical protein [Phenylobacterium deserti]|uniref:hypothetical protein n=1 Tax=Phenylobacterium deserti TaxID=1914756 RepID=UPI00105794FD|nr:hypothetical protein [Phenylobacterium deserti]